MTNNPNELLKDIDRRTIVPAADPSREAALMAAFDAATERGRPQGSVTGWMALGTTAAFVALAGTSLYRNAPITPDPSVARAEGPADSGFHIWPGAEFLPRFESGQLVRMNLPDSGVRADVLIGQDGLPRAYRVVLITQLEQSR